MAGKVIDPLGGFEIGPANGLRKFKVSGAGADEGGHMASATEDGAEVMTVGTNVEALGAVNTEANAGHGDFEDFAFVDADTARRAIDCFPLAREFIEGNAVLLDGGNHGGNLFELACKFLEGGFDGGTIQIGDGFGFENLALGILGVGGLS